jgi:Cu-processing system permease protein
MATAHKPNRFSRPSTLSVVRSVGKVTFMEIVRDKILYSSILSAVLLMAIAYLASRLSFTRPERIVTDFGLAVANLASTLIAVFIGSPMLGKEFERRTIYVALSKPVSRFQFLLGKYFGLTLVILVNWALLSVAYLAIIRVVDGPLNPTLLWGLVLVLFQTFVVGSIAVMFSSMSTASVAAMLTLGVFLTGNNISQIRFLAKRADTPFGTYLLNFIADIFPNLEHFSLGTKVTYGLPVAWGEGLHAIGYAALVVTAFLCAAGLLIRQKDA